MHITHAVHEINVSLVHSLTYQIETGP